MIPLLTKFNSDSVLYDSIGNPVNSYICTAYDNKYIYFLKDAMGTVIRYDVITENYSELNKIYSNDTTVYIEGQEILDVPINQVYVKSGDNIFSIVKYKGSLYGFNGFDAKKFVGDTVLYILDNDKLVQESFDRQLKIIHLSSATQIADFFIDDDMNYYVLHNKNVISKFTKDRILLYSATITPSVSTAFNELAVMPNDEITLIKMDYVREYTKEGFKEYPIILGNIKNGTVTLKPNELFLCKIDESQTNTLLQDLNIVYDVSFLGLTGAYYPNGYPYENPQKVKYNLTNYEYLKNRYVPKNEIVFRIVLSNVYNNHDKIDIEIPVNTDSFSTEYHHFAFRLDGINGLVSVFCDGKEIKTVEISKGQYIFQDIFKDGLTIGKTYFHNSENLDTYLNQPNYYYINNSNIKQFKIYKKALTNNEIDYHVYRGSDMRDLVVSLPCDQRNELDGIERQFKLDTNGNKSNKINIIIKNSQITTPVLREEMKKIISEKLKKVLPITTIINNIEFR